MKNKKINKLIDKIPPLFFEGHYILIISPFKAKLLVILEKKYTFVLLDKKNEIIEVKKNKMKFFVEKGGKIYFFKGIELIHEPLYRLKRYKLKKLTI